MTTKTERPVIDGWFTTDGEPRLLGNRCKECGTYVFPRLVLACPNPACAGTEFDQVPLSRRGRVWSYTTNHYAPPPPYVAAEPFEPYTVVAVELSEEKLVVLGQVAGDASGLKVGTDVELMVDTLFETDDERQLVWKWSVVK